MIYMSKIRIFDSFVQIKKVAENISQQP